MVEVLIVGAAAALVVAEVGANDPLNVVVVAAKLVVAAVKLMIAAVKLVAVGRPAVEDREGVALGERVVEKWVVVGRVGAAPAPGCGSPWAGMELALRWH